MDKNITEGLEKHGFNCFEGTLGSLIELPTNSQYSETLCLLNPKFPPNLHEYDIVVVDLQNPNMIPYDMKDHAHENSKAVNQYAFNCPYPQRVFDPRGFSAEVLKSDMAYLLDKESILIVFAAEDETIDYQMVAITPRGLGRSQDYRYSIYNFFIDLPNNRNLMGKDIRVVYEGDSELLALLNRHKDKMHYRITFSHPLKWTNSKSENDPLFVRLLEGRPNDVVAFAMSRRKNLTLLFPQVSEKEKFMIDLLEKSLPGIIPGVFPFSTRFAWLTHPQYQLPDEEDLQLKKKFLKDEYNKKINDIDNQISHNQQKYEFLHNLLTQSGSELVKAIELFLQWLGFENIVNVDEQSPSMKEEDLRIESDRGLFVIEVKGISGTSTDKECMQVAKFRNRRTEERGKFDVSALFIVNHERFLPPESRTTPPFKEIQIQDAKDDKRGLITTYDLFKLYFIIKQGIISNEDARAALFQTGLVEFSPSNSARIPPNYEIHYNNSVIKFKNNNNMQFYVGMEVILEDNGRYLIGEILEIRVQEQSVERADSGEIGLKLSIPIHKETKVWVRLPMK